MGRSHLCHEIVSTSPLWRGESTRYLRSSNIVAEINYHQSRAVQALRLFCVQNIEILNLNKWERGSAGAPRRRDELSIARSLLSSIFREVGSSRM